MFSPEQMDIIFIVAGILLLTCIAVLGFEKLGEWREKSNR